MPLPSPTGKPTGGGAPGGGGRFQHLLSTHARTCFSGGAHTPHLSRAFWFTKALPPLFSNLRLTIIPRQAFLSSSFSKETGGAGVRGGSSGELISRLQARSHFPGFLGDALGRSPCTGGLPGRSSPSRVKGTGVSRQTWMGSFHCQLFLLLIPALRSAETLEPKAS